MNTAYKSSSITLRAVTEYESLHCAWRKVRANNGGPGVDAVTCVQYESEIDANLNALSASLRDGTYLPEPLRAVVISKRDGGERHLSIPVIDDRVAQRAFADGFEQIYEPLFLDCSYGYRPGRSVADAVGAIEKARAAGLTWIVDADISDFFGAVRHGHLMSLLREIVDDEGILRTIALWLRVISGGPPPARRFGSAYLRIGDGLDQIVGHAVNHLGGASPEEEFGSFDAAASIKQDVTRAALRCASLAIPKLSRSPSAIAVAAVALASGGAMYAVRRKLDGSGRGVSQGAPISPLLSNIYLSPFDRAMTANGLTLIRYADDFVICTSSAVRAQNALNAARRELAAIGLSLKDAKTHIIAPNESFRFLGYEFDRHGAALVPQASTQDRMRDAKRSLSRAGRNMVERTRRIKDRRKE